jgi:hypothetical protein
MIRKLTFASALFLASTASQAADFGFNKDKLFSFNAASKNCASNLAQLANQIQAAGKLPNLEVALANGNPEKLSPGERQLFERAEAVAKQCKGIHAAFHNAMENLDAMDKAGKTPSAEELAEIKNLDAGMKQANQAFANAQKVPAMGGFLRRVMDPK